MDSLLLKKARRFARLLLVLNLGACWLRLRRGPRTALAYLHHIWHWYLWPDGLRMVASEPCLLPEVEVEAVVPGVDLQRAELLCPLAGPGGVRPEELVIINALVRHQRPRRLVEIGTAEGRTTLNLAFHAPEGAEVITLDLPPEAPQATHESGPDYRQWGMAEPGRLFLDHPLAARIRRVSADSSTFDWSPYFRSVDFLFIDGGHDY